MHGITGTVQLRKWRGEYRRGDGWAEGEIKRQNKQLKREVQILKKASAYFREHQQSIPGKCEFIAENRTEHQVKELCCILNVGQRTYYDYAQKKRNQVISRRQQENYALALQIKGIFTGSRRVQKILGDQGLRVNRKRVVKLMIAEGLYCKTSRKYKTGRSSSASNHAPNLKESLGTISKVNQLWSTDITYLKTTEGWMFLCVVLDEYSRKVIGWSIEQHMRVELVIVALSMPLTNREQVSGELVIHSDRGSQYTSSEYYGFAKEHGLRVSMSGCGRCYDNAKVERFFRTLKDENTRFMKLKPASKLRAEIVKWIELDYNLTRHHTAIGDLSPMNFESVQSTSITI